jgi:SNF2 family DNA or RNA helicase
MDAGTESDEALRHKQQLFAAQMQNGPSYSEYDVVPFKELEDRFNQASGAYMLRHMNGEVDPDEEAIYKKLQAQYSEAKARQDELLRSQPEITKDSVKRRRASPSPLFVQQDGPDRDEGFDATNKSSRSKKKRIKTSNSSSESSRLLKVDASLMESVNRRIVDAPAEKKQAAIRDGARILHAGRKFPPGSIEYDGGHTWSIKGMKTSLRHHQLINAGWMKEQEVNKRGPKGGILADDMGLGKTISALTSMVHGNTTFGQKELKTNLVIVHKSLQNQWANEAYYHTEEATSETPYGLGRIHIYSHDTSVKFELRKFKEANLVIATYSELYRGFKNFVYPKDLSEAAKEKYFDKHYRSELSALFQFKFRAVYLDEGHDIRNPKALRSMACQKLQSEYRWILTGTPMTNDPKDLYSVLVFIRDPAVSELTLREFKDKYKGPSKNDINVDWIADILQRCMSRWTHQNMLFGRQLVDIPKPIIKDICKRFSFPEKIIYWTLRDRLEALAIEMMIDPDNTKSYRFVKGLLMVLRQMTGHVLLIRPVIFRYLTDEDMSSIYNEIHDNGNEEQPEPTQMITNQTIKQEPAEPTELDPHAQDYIKALRKLQKSTTCVACGHRTPDVLWAECYHAYCKSCLAEKMHHDAEQGFKKPRCEPCGVPMGRLTDKAEDAEDESPRWLNESGKVIPSTKSSVVVELLKSWRDPLTGDPQAKAVVFTSFKDSHKFLAATFEEEQWEFTVLTSAMSSAEREQSVEEFMEDPDKFIMLATNGVGGIGLNLTAAKYVFDTWILEY